MRALRVATGIAALSLLGPVAGAGQSTVERTLPFDRAGAFRIMVMEGSVRARAWDRDSIRVTARLDAEAARGFYMGVSPGGEGGKLGVEGSGRGEVEVLLPRGASLWIKTAGAGIDVAGLAGPLDVFSVTGDIRLDGNPRSVSAESMGGAVRLTGEPGVARVRTGAGTMEIRGGGDDLTLSSVNGAISLVATRPLRRVAVETVGGRVAIAAALSPGATLVINSHDGPVDLALPPETSADFVVSTLEGALRNELSAGGARKTTGLRGRELSFTTGFGGAQVTVRTFSADVTVRRRGDG